MQAEFSNNSINTNYYPVISSIQKKDDSWIDQDAWHLLSKKIYEESKNFLEWDSFNSLFDSGYALRHVSSYETAQEELESGTDGDAVSISAGLVFFLESLAKDKNLLSKKSLKEYLDTETKSTINSLGKDSSTIRVIYRILLRALIQGSIQFTDQDKSTILKEVEKALRKFIFTSTFHHDNPIPRKATGWKNDWEQALSTSTSFLIVKKEENPFPYDQKNYQELGKLGRNKIQINDLKSAIAPPTQECISKAEQGISDMTERVVAIQQAVVDYYLQELLSRTILKS